MPLKLYRRGEIWHYRGTVAGRKLRGSTTTAIKEIAERIVSEKEQAAWKGHFDPQGVATFAQAAILYRRAAKSDRFLKKIEDFWKDTLIREVTPGAIKNSAFVLYPGVSAATMNRQVIVPTQAIINNAAEHGVCQRIRVKRFDIKQQTVKIPATLEWVKAFMAACDEAGKPNIGASACLMYFTGARVTQAISIRWEDVNFKTRQVLIRATEKGDDDRLANMPNRLVIALANIPGDRVGRVFGFRSRQNLAKQWEDIAEKAELELLTPHCCRHGFATGLLDRGVNPKTVAQRGGWKDVQHMLKSYAHDIARSDITDVLDDDTPDAQVQKKAM